MLCVITFEKRRQGAGEQMFDSEDEDEQPRPVRRDVNSMTTTKAKGPQVGVLIYMSMVVSSSVINLVGVIVPLSRVVIIIFILTHKCLWLFPTSGGRWTIEK